VQSRHCPHRLQHRHQRSRVESPSQANERASNCDLDLPSSDSDAGGGFGLTRSSGNNDRRNRIVGWAMATTLPTQLSPQRKT
jgi:hypothetical protein